MCIVLLPFIIQNTIHAQKMQYLVYLLVLKHVVPLIFVQIHIGKKASSNYVIKTWWKETKQFILVVFVVVDDDPRNIPLKCCKNLACTSWDIADIEFVWLVWWLNCGYVGFVTEIWVWDECWHGWSNTSNGPPFG